VSVLVAGIAVTLSLMLAAFCAELGIAGSLKARAQLAADAVALAAVAESGPYGSAKPEGTARRYAEANGATLLECRCVPGATAVQVSVKVGAVVADARAVLDPNFLMPATLDGDVSGLDPRLRQAVNRLIAASEGSVQLVSGYRSHDHQLRLWNEALAKYGSAEAADDWVAPPGHSMHERGLAVDLGGNLELAVRTVEQLDLPLWRPMSHEPWHFELVGSRAS
jgi:D-alanyl-D-alanine carboxypeptidase